MNLSEFDYNLPKSLIAQSPIEPRDQSKLLLLDKKTWEIQDKVFYEIIDYLWENDVLVLNKTKVLKARLIWELITENWNLSKNKSCEVFLHKQISWNTWDCLVYPWKKFKIWTSFSIKDKLFWIVKEISQNWRIIEFDTKWKDFLEIIEDVWETPTPPYIKQKLQDDSRYQTIFSSEIWSVAAPTAWLHFTKDLLDKIEKKWVKIEYVLLHIWLWTFKWIECENILEHKMHSEFISIDKETCDRLNNYKKSGKNIVSVWTTSTRALESFVNEKWILESWQKETCLFIYPWYSWKFIDKLITNFHLPKSSLIILVSALAWQKNIMQAYNHAINNNYRFFSFWDAMFIK